jgi:hypothetical protein
MSSPQDSQTWNEVFVQPEIWAKWGRYLAPRANEIRDWIRRLHIKEIVFAGDGALVNASGSLAGAHINLATRLANGVRHVGLLRSARGAHDERPSRNSRS